MNPKKIVSKLANTLAPSMMARRRLNKVAGQFSEPELHLLPALCDRNKISVDAGAKDGVFSAHMLPLSRRVVAFEPRPDAAGKIKALLAIAPAASVEAVALSDKLGTCSMRIANDAPGLSTIDEANPMQDARSITQINVPVRTLDSYQFENVGFVKIDVEGHELALLHGAEQTIKRNRPNLLIEAENRHKANAVANIWSFLNANYSGFFQLDGKLKPIGEFDAAVLQNPANAGCEANGWKLRGVYINNFIFIPSERAREFANAVARLT